MSQPNPNLQDRAGDRQPYRMATATKDSGYQHQHPWITMPVPVVAVAVRLLDRLTDCKLYQST